jgi:hypothetical protein
MFSVPEGNLSLGHLPSKWLGLVNGSVHSRCFHTTEITASAVSASFYYLDVKNSKVSFSIDVVYTISLAAGSSNVVNFQDRSWPTIPAPESVQPYPKALESKLLGKEIYKSQILTAVPEKFWIEAEVLKH